MTSQDPRTDRELIEQVASGNSSALGAFYDRHGVRVLGLCHRILGNVADAEEAAGDVFWQVWEQAARYDARKGEPLAWLVTIARSRAIDRLRSAKRKLESALDETTIGELGAAGSNSAQDEMANPRDAAARRQMRAHIEAGLASLDPEQRRVVEMAFYLGFTHSEIASELGEPLGTVKTRIRQGLIRLRDGLRTLYDPEARS